MLQFITNEECGRSATEQIKAAIAGGCRWIQIRMKNSTDDEIKKVVEEIMPICLDTESFLILDDRVELAKELNVGGVHLGREDMPPSKARILLGPAAVIGVTANTFEDVRNVAGLDIDYIGVGPYAMTTTKKNLAPVLGLDGIAAIKSDMNANNIEIPLVAVGGITADDIPALLEAGADGVAVSGAIARAEYMEKATKELIKLIQ